MNKRLLVVLLAAGCLCRADSIRFGTAVAGTIESNSLTGYNVVTLPADAWHHAIGQSEWESIRYDSLDPAIPNGTLVHFYFNLFIPGDPLSGHLNLLVDDSASGWLNGHLLFDNLNDPQAAHCAGSLPNCVKPFDLQFGDYLKPGFNRLDILVSQDGGAQFGLDLYGLAEYRKRPVPHPTSEPGSLSLIAAGAGLLGIGFWRRKP